MKTTTLVDNHQMVLYDVIEQHGLTMKNKRKTRNNIIKIKSLVAFLLFSLYQTAPVHAKSGSTPTLQPRVTTDEVQLYQHTQEIEVPGVWVAKNEITVSSPLQAIRVKRILVDEGDVVKAGQLLAELEDMTLKTNVISAESLLAQVKAKIGEIKVRKREAESMYNRSKKLKETNSISSQQLDELSATAQSYHHQLLAVEAEARQVEQQLVEARSQLDKSEIRSPVDGIISMRFIQEGELVNFSQLFRLISQNQIEFEAMVTQNLMSQLKQGMPVQVSHQKELVDGTVRLIGTSIQKETGIATIRIKPNNPAMVSSGSAGKAIFKFESTAKAAVDTRALRYEGVSPYVFVVNAQQCVESRPIVLGPRYINKVEVLSGLTVGEHIVLSSSAFLKDGDCIGLHDDNEPEEDIYETDNDAEQAKAADEADIYEDAEPIEVKTEQATKTTKATKPTQPETGGYLDDEPQNDDNKDIEIEDNSDSPYDW